MYDADVDMKRLVGISEFKRVHADTIVGTTHLIKKSVMIPISVSKSQEIIEPKNTK
jgi:hypothetical protein